MAAESALRPLSAVDAAAAVRDGRLSSEALVDAYLKRIAEAEDEVQAFAFLDPDYARKQARAADESRRRGKPLGALHGVPVGVKDIVDTRDFGTENGTVLHAGRRPRQDATIVTRLRAAGAVVLGKTVTTELAVYSPGKTRNPRNLAHTPGGSSSGSAAAVAAGMVPLAIGTQTNGSVIRPASFCGVYGYKPSHGLIPRTGVLRQSPPLDTIGTMAATLEDNALLADALLGADGVDRDVPAQAAPGLLAALAEPPPLPPKFAFVRTPAWDQADEDLKVAFGELTDALGGRVEPVDLPRVFDRAIELHRTIMEADLARSFAHEYEAGRDRLSEVLRTMLERGQEVRAVDYNRALDTVPAFNGVLDELFERYDAILTPATLGEAPEGQGATGSPVFCTIWTLAGTPALTLPLLEGARGLPIGVQLVGRKGEDGRLFRNARFLLETLRAAA